MDHMRLYHAPIPEFIRKISAAPALFRLRDVGMNCGLEYTSFPFFKDIPPYSRYEHSIGAALIVWHFTRDEKQTCAALLHDIATPVFAHVVDFLKGDHMKQEATEEKTEELILADEEILSVLADLGLGAGDVADYHRYPIADNDAPRLASDRLEYTLGNILNFGFGKEEDVKELYEDLFVGENEDGDPEIVFRTPRKALAFSQYALACSEIYVSDPDRCSMEVLAGILKQAISSGVIGEADLYTTEGQVIRKLAGDAVFREEWRRFRRLDTILKAKEKEDDTWIRVYAKKRYIDPLIAGKGRVSHVFPAYRAALDAFLNENQDDWMKAVSHEDHTRQ